MPVEFISSASRSETLAQLRRLALEPAGSRQGVVTYLDTFDWRVHRAGYVLRHVDDTAELLQRSTGSLVAKAPAKPLQGCFSADLPPALRERVGSALGIRSMLDVATVTSTETELVARNADDKMVARVVLSVATTSTEGRRVVLPLHVSVLPLRGYDKAARRIVEALTELPGMVPAESTFYDDALEAHGRRRGDYTGKLALRLDRAMTAADALRLIATELVGTMTVNEAGTIADLDSEFLHDFRVAVRRMRSALKELPDVLDPAIERRGRAEFRWLGDVTTPTRDLDVYLLAMPDFRAAVGNPSDALDPLEQLLRGDQRKAHAVLARTLRGRRYTQLRDEWSGVGDADGEAGPAGADAIGPLADARIARVARRVWRDGSRIGADTPAEALHDLRKRCKELRYLLEFFASLYDGKTHGAVVSELKDLQDNLGRFQDTQVQREAMEAFAERLVLAGGRSSGTLLLMGQLVGTFDDRQRAARAEFADRFAAFAAPENRERLAALTGGAG